MALCNRSVITECGQESLIARAAFGVSAAGPRNSGPPGSPTPSGLSCPPWRSRRRATHDPSSPGNSRPAGNNRGQRGCRPSGLPAGIAAALASTLRALSGRQKGEWAWKNVKAAWRFAGAHLLNGLAPPRWGAEVPVAVRPEVKSYGETTPLIFSMRQAFLSIWDHPWRGVKCLRETRRILIK